MELNYLYATNMESLKSSFDILGKKCFLINWISSLLAANGDDDKNEDGASLVLMRNSHKYILNKIDQKMNNKKKQ